MITIKSKAEIKLLANSGKIAEFLTLQLKKNVKAGVTTKDLDMIANRVIDARGAKPSFLNYQNYPASICVSINEEVVHGIPGKRVIKSGDLVKVDLGVNYQGYHTDTAFTVFVAHANEKVLNLIKGTKRALDEAVAVAKPGNRVGDIEAKIGQTLRRYGLAPVMDLTGHGIGTEVHEEPSIRCDGKPGTGPVLKEGMVLAIEPMATLGSGDVITGPDGWTVVAADKTLAAHFEHTIVITSTGSRMLTGAK